LIVFWVYFEGFKTVLILAYGPTGCMPTGECSALNNYKL
jgi:hypothetical protein